MAEGKKADIASLTFVAFLALITAIILGLVVKIHSQAKIIEAYKNAPADTMTVIRHDTIKVDNPVPVYKYVKEKEYVTITDSLLVHDTITHLIELPREYLVYKDSAYRAVVSGVQPRLDTMEVYQKTITQTVTKYVDKPAPFLKPYGGVGAFKELGGNDYGGKVLGGIEIRGKVSLQAEYQHTFKDKRDYVGGAVILKF